MIPSWTMVSMITLPLLSSPQVCNPLCLLRLSVGMELEEDGDIFLQLSSSFPNSGCLTLTLQEEKKELPVWEQGWGQIVPMTSSKKILTQSKGTKWVLIVGMGIGTKQGEREEESSGVLSPHPLPSLSMRSSLTTMSYLETSSILCQPWRNYSCLWTSTLSPHSILSHLCYLCEPLCVFFSLFS